VGSYIGTQYIFMEELLELPTVPTITISLSSTQQRIESCAHEAAANNFNSTQPSKGGREVYKLPPVISPLVLASSNKSAKLPMVTG